LTGIYDAFISQTGSVLFERYSTLDESYSHRPRPVDFVARGTQHLALNGTQAVESLRECIASSKFTTGAVTSWMDSFEQYRISSQSQQPTSETEYDALVKTWLQDPHTPPIMSTDIAWADDNVNEKVEGGGGERIASTKIFHAFHVGSGTIQSAQDGLDAMLAMQSCADAASTLDVFAFSELYVQGTHCTE